MDITAFTALGFTPNETSVYLALIEQGRAAAQTIAKRVKLRRTTVYSVLDSLDEKGLIRREQERGTTFFRVDDPGSILGILEKQESRLHENRAVAKLLVEQLRPVFKSGGYRVPKVDYAEGKGKVEKFLYANLAGWTESILKHDRSTWGYQDHTFVDHFDRWIKEAWKVLHRDAGIAGRILSNRSGTERSLRGKIPRREVRALKAEFNFQSSIWVMGDFVVLIMTRTLPVYAFQIHEPLLADGLRHIFRHLYERASTDL